ncbi:hypothetical protein ACPCIU_00980 [Streptomyces seoulensis]|uniref:hypothetical protein n=1 Tax=Streptomyces seoulensis TaxID=73044 RepID=UPI003C2CD28E
MALISYAAPGSVAHGRVLFGAGLVLLPWFAYLAGALPPADAAAWVALDALEAAALLTAGRRLLRRDARYRAPAAAAAVLLLADACVDVATSPSGPALVVAVVMAVVAELPLAGLCAVLAGRPTRRFDRRGVRVRRPGGRCAGTSPR